MGTPIMFPLCTFLQRMTLRMFADYKVLGQENVPPMGPLIIVANHQSNFDPSVLGASIPRRMWFLAKEGMFWGPVAKWFLRSYGAFPVNREGPDIRAYRWVFDKLKHGQAMVIYPEGTRSNGALQEAKSGVVRLALTSKAPLLPVGVTGTERLGNRFSSLQPHGKDQGEHRAGVLAAVYRWQVERRGFGLADGDDNAPDCGIVARELSGVLQVKGGEWVHNSGPPLNLFQSWGVAHGIYDIVIGSLPGG